MFGEIDRPAGTHVVVYFDTEIRLATLANLWRQATHAKAFLYVTPQPVVLLKAMPTSTALTGLCTGMP